MTVTKETGEIRVQVGVAWSCVKRTHVGGNTSEGSCA